MRVSNTRTATVIGSALSAGLIVGFGVVAWAGSPSDQVDEPTGPPPAPTAPPSPGQKLLIGPWTMDQPPPDLVPINLKDGKTGYLRTYDLAHGSANPKFTRRTSENSTETVLPVYSYDGQTVIDEFVAGTTSWE